MGTDGLAAGNVHIDERQPKRRRLRGKQAIGRVDGCVARSPEAESAMPADADDHSQLARPAQAQTADGSGGQPCGGDWMLESFGSVSGGPPSAAINAASVSSGPADTKCKRPTGVYGASAAALNSSGDGAASGGSTCCHALTSTLDRVAPGLLKRVEQDLAARHGARRPDGPTSGRPPD